MKKSLTLLLTAAFAVSALTACGSSDNETKKGNDSQNETSASQQESSKSDKESVKYPVEIENELGATVIESEPNAIAVFDVGMLDILDTLGFGDRVVAVTHGQAFPEYLSEYDGERYVNLGGFKDWDEEALVNSNPDLILAGFRQNNDIETVTAIAPTLYFSDGNSYIDTLRQRVNAVTAMFGGEEEAEAYLADINEKIAKIKSFTDENDVTFVIVTAENGTLSLGGSGNGTTFLADALGLVSLYEDTGMGGRGGKGENESDLEEGKGGGRTEGGEGGRDMSGSKEGGEGGRDMSGSKEDGEGGRDMGGSKEDGEGGRDMSSSKEDGEGGRTEGEEESDQTAEVVAYLEEKNPAYVFVYDKDAAEREEGQPTSEEVVAGAGMDNVTAYQNGNVICVDSTVWSSAAGGLKATTLQLDTLITLFGLN